MLGSSCGGVEKQAIGDRASFQRRLRAQVHGVTQSDGSLMGTPSFRTKTVPEFITFANANPSKLSMASAGTRSGPLVAGELR
jgi:tripartite-type tricarboxylate transporter receptor subunit TctC